MDAANSAEQVAVRQATAEEANEVAEVLLQARHANEPDIPNLVHSDDEVRGWVAAVLMDQCEVWVAVVDSEIVGMMALRDDWIEQLYVAPGHTSRGIGARLIATAQDRSPAGLQLWTFEANRRAQRFYERHGFVAVERSDGSRNEEGAPDVRYRWAYSSKKSVPQVE
jgi:GNAT superfamily N-acetyltransferase